MGNEHPSVHPSSIPASSSARGLSCWSETAAIHLRLPGGAMRSAAAWTSIFFAMFFSACHRGALNEDPSPRYSGGYEYRADVSGEELGGLMVVSSDTIFLYPKGHECHPVPGRSHLGTIGYECPGAGSYHSVQFCLNRYNPVRNSYWRGTKTVRKQRRVCTRYTTNAAGREVCAQTGLQSYDEDVTLGGPLRVWPATGRG